MSGSGFDLGPFAVEAVVGEGGMGRVWRGSHRRQTVPVAVKVLNERFCTPKFANAFRNEARAVAQLDHPHIVVILDYGLVPQGGIGPLAGRSPYLVMDFASGGSLDKIELPLPFDLVKTILLTMLDALAHAHARSVIHRDLKPGNILLAGGSDVRPGLKLTDFGIAHAVTDAVREGLYEETAGTPEYMAPEQFMGRFRDYGPWTDLYALGCVAYELVTGDVPFTGGLFCLAKQHMSAIPPDLRDACPGLPDGFARWVGRLLEKPTHARFQRAADAAWALFRIGPPVSMVAVRGVGDALEESGSFVGVPGGDAETIICRADTLVATGELGLRVSTESEGQRASSGSEWVPVPYSWRRFDADRPIRLLGAGLGLWGLRDVPLVGREEVRDAIWGRLRACVEKERPRMVVLDGAAGVGKSRLAKWICRRAHEVGCATIMTAHHSVDRGPQDGLQGMVARYLNCRGLAHDDTLDRVRTRLQRDGVTDPWEWETLAGWLAPPPDADRLTADSAKHARMLAGRLLERAASQRPLILRVEDLHYGPEIVPFLTGLISGASRSSILVIATVRADEFALGSRSEADFEALLASPACARIPVSRLSERDTRTLVQEVLGARARPGG